MRLLLLALTFAVSTMSGDYLQIGALSYDTLIPSDGTNPGIDVFSIADLSGDPNLGGFALPPDFPASDFVSLLNSSLAIDENGELTDVDLGELDPGFYTPDSLDFVDTTAISSVEFTATLSETSILLSDGTTFIADSPTVDVLLTPSSGDTLQADIDAAVITISGEIASSVPEPSTAWLAGLATAMLLFWRVWPRKWLHATDDAIGRRRRSGDCAKIFRLKGEHRTSAPIVGPLVIAMMLLPALTGSSLYQAWAASTPVQLSASTSPGSGQPGVTAVSITGTGYPTGTISASQVTVVLEPATPGAGPTVSVTARTASKVVGTTWSIGFQVPAAPSLVPNSGLFGTTVSVSITDQSGSMVSGQTQARFGAGISVGGAAEGGYGPVVVTNAHTATAQLTIDSAASLGSRSVTIQTGTDSVTLDAFVVLSTASSAPVAGVGISVAGQTPYYVSVSGSTTTGSVFASSNQAALIVNPAAQVNSLAPASSPPGVSLTVSLTGLYTNFLQGSTVANFGSGVSVGGAGSGNYGPLNVLSPTSATATLTIDPAAMSGSRTVVVQTGVQLASLYGGFTVLTTPPTLLSISPPSGQQGQAAGSVFLTGHDPDFHAFAGGNNAAGAVGINQAAIAFVTNPQFNTFSAAGIHKFLYVTASSAPAGGHVDGTNGLIASGFVQGTDFDRADASTLGTALNQLGTTYSALVVASDFGGNLTQAELGIADAEANLIINFLNQGGGLYAMAETSPADGGSASSGYFGFLPFIVTSYPFNEVENGNTATPYGASIGLTTFDINGNFSHNTFISTGGLNIVDADAGGEILTLAGRGTVSASGLTTVLITGTNTHFSQSTTQVSFGVGIAVGTVTVTDATHLTALITISPSAALGPRTVTITTGTEVATLPNGFTVIAPIVVTTPLITQVTPNVGQPGQSLQIVLTGQNTHFAQGTSQVSFGSDISVTGVTVASAVSVTANITIPANDTAGMRNVMVTTGSEVAALASGFTVQPSATLLSVAPISAQAGQTLPIVITGSFTHFTQGTTLVTLGSDITVTSVTVASTTSLTANITIPSTATIGAHSITVTTGSEAVTLPSSFTVVAPLLPPSITITSPTPNAIITQVTNIVGSIADPNGANGGPMTWTLGILKPGATAYTTLASGTGPVSNAVIGQVDPTLLPNDIYPIQVTATKGPYTDTASLMVSVAGNLKLGNFTVQFTDLSIPVAGIPITITRRYNSLDTSVGEFGAGWHLALPGQISDSAGGQAYTQATRIYVTTVNGTREGFTFAPYFSGVFLPFWSPAFTPDPGVNDALSVAPDTLFFSSNAFFTAGGAYIPTLFTLTTVQGVQYQIDENAGLQRITDTNGNTLTVTPGGLISSTGVSVTFQRDALNRITKITEPGTSPGTLQYAYDTNGNLSTFTDQNGNVTTYWYQNTTFPNYLTSIVDPLGRPTVRTVYNSSGQIIAQCNANGNPTTLVGCATFSPNSAANIQTIINGNGYRTDLLLDANGNVLTERHWLDSVNHLDTVRTYDANNNLLTITDPAGNLTTNTYDGSGNLLSTTDPLGHVTKNTYNSCNKVLTTTDPAGNLTTNTYDAFCNLLTVTDPLGNTTTLTYNSQGSLTDFVDAVGNRTSWQYDVNGYITGYVDPLKNATSLVLGPTGDLMTRIDRNGKRVDFAYDATHSLTTETWASVPTRVTTYLYDAAGQLTSVIDPDSSITTIYTNTGLLSTVDNNNTAHVPRVIMMYGYDADSNVISVQDSLGGTTAYVYDALNRLSQVTQTGIGVNPKLVNFQYDNASFLTQLSRFSDLAGTQGVATSIFSTDCDGCPGRITGIQHRNASNDSVIDNLTFARDPLGNVVSSTDADGTHTYSYDEARQLLAASHSDTGIQPNEFYTYDAIGNRLASQISSAYVYGYMSAAGTGTRLMQDQQFIYVYDNEGNLIQKTNRVTGAYTQFTYDFRNRTSSIVQFNPDGTLGSTTSLRYDAFNRRVLINSNGQDVSFVYDRLNPAFELSPTGAPITRRLYSRSVDDVLAEDVAGTTRWYVLDQVGSPRDLVSNSGSSLVHYTYDSFGRLQNQSVQTIQNDLLFTGRESASNLPLYFRSRFYDPSLGRFLSEDPIGFGSGSPSLYTYVANNPINGNDPSGADAFEEAFEAVLANGFAQLVGNLFLSKVEADVVESFCSPKPSRAEAVGLFLPALASNYGKTLEELFVSGFRLPFVTLGTVFTDIAVGCTVSFIQAHL